MHDKGKKMHRPRTDAASGQRHKKRVRTPHNTREKQRQIALGHGETLMPNNVIYRTPNSVMNSEDSAYNSMGGGSHYDSRPNRPNSIEIRRSYPAEGVDGYAPASPHYQQTSYQQQVYDESIYNSQNLYSGQGPLSQESLYAPGTPSRGKPRPSQPPPAPPTTGDTPTASNAGTPTRGRSMSTGRDALPPPPPVPMETLMSSPPGQMTNGNSAIAAKLLARSHSTSRSGSPQLNTSGPHDPNAMVMAQLNSQINNLNNLNLQMSHQMNAMNDLPPPPPIPEQVSTSTLGVSFSNGGNNTNLFQLSPKQSPPKVAPPPPPPPPPLLEQSPSTTLFKPMGNGEIANGLANLIKPTKINQKKILPTIDDTRNDLLKAIRDGEFNQRIFLILNLRLIAFSSPRRYQTP